MRRVLGIALAAVAMGAMLAPAADSAAAATCAPAKHAGGDWPMYGHDYRNSRFQDKEYRIGTLQVPTLQPAWAFSTDGKGDFSGTPIVTDGCVYVGTNDGWAFALNADTGKQVWATRVSKQGGINSSAGVDGGRVFFAVSQAGKPSVVALDQTTGKLLWQTVETTQPGSDVYASPIVYDGMVFVGFSGGAAELGDESDRYKFQGGFVLLDAKTGRLIKRTYTIHSPSQNKKDKFAGGAIWATPAIDTADKVAFVGSGNPFRPQAEHKYTDSILKIDLDRSSPRFGQIIDHYKGTVDNYEPATRELPCFDTPGNPPPYYPQGAGACANLDMDFGSSPNLYVHDGELHVGEGQKSGVYHIVEAETMKPHAKGIVGIPTAVGGIVGSTAMDGDAIYGPTTQGYLWSISVHDGTPDWVAPVADGAHWGNAVSVAKGVVYTTDVKGALDAYDAATGAPLLHRPMEFDAQNITASFGGVSIARNTVYAAIGTLGLPNGYIIAYRPAGP